MSRGKKKSHGTEKEKVSRRKKKFHKERKGTCLMPKGNDSCRK